MAESDAVGSAAGARRSLLWPEPTEDRRRAGRGPTVAVAVLLGVSFRAALATLALQSRGGLFIDLAASTAVLAVLVLRSIPLRWVVRSYAVLGAALMARFGWLADDPGVAAAGGALLWAVCIAAAHALCPRPIARYAVGVVASGLSPAERTTRWQRLVFKEARVAGDGGRRGSTRPVALNALVLRGVVAVVALVAVVTAIVGPFAGVRAGTLVSNGGQPDGLDRGPDNALAAQDSLDMTTRPRLTDAVVMTVESDVGTFWRTDTFDRWDGSTWTRSDGRFLRPVVDFRLTHTPDDLAAVSGRPSTQVFRLQSRFANVLPVAASAVSVRSSMQLYQRLDGSLLAPQALGRGALYLVGSRQSAATGAGLREDRGPIPDDVRQRYATPAPTTERVRDLAATLAGSVPTQYGRIMAIEAWMAGHLTYSLDAPLSPSGVDVVDDFLFRSKIGWCEQIASSLVVMLREVGVPARLATGFAPGAFDRSTGRYVVRERDAHAWAEVWFPGTGWVPFDPTAQVPFAGDPASRAPAVPIGFAGLAVILVFVAAVAVVSVPLARWLHRWRQRQAEAAAARRLAAQRWDVRVEQELEQMGREVGRPRLPSETVSAHASQLALVTGQSELAEQGREVDELRYSPPGRPDP